MPDPIIGTAIAKKAIDAMESDVKQAAPNLVQRVLGPAADEIGEALRRWTSYRVGNVTRILEVAERKSDGPGNLGSVHPRIAHQILEDGSYCDDELMAEYYGGVLAAGRTPSGRDDRAVSWSALVSGMSAIQVRVHYLLYREWAARLSRVPTLNLGIGVDRTRVRMDVDLDEFFTLLRNEDNSEISPNSLLGDGIVGLERIGLLADDYTFGPRGLEGGAEDSPYENTLRVEPSPSGMELYGWAQGTAGIAPIEFPKKALPFEMEPPIPRLTRVTFMLLSEKNDSVGE